jgi:uncharacterized protein (TIGR02001 family)
VRCRFISAFWAGAWLLSTAPAFADIPDCSKPLTGPFGGELHANLTLATDYAKSGISSTENQPAFQVGADWHSPCLLDNGPPLTAYVAGLGSNVSFPGVGQGLELDLAGGFKLGLFKHLTVDVGYIRYFYPSYAADLGFEYGEYSLKADYDFGPLTVSGRLRYSPDTINHAGQTWEKRALVSVPIHFLPLPDGLKLKTYGSLGNTWVEKPEVLALSGNEFWFWQVGLVMSVSRLNLDITLAYTDTSITSESCGFTRACEGRFFASITKVF